MDLRSFLGLDGYYKRFLKDFNKVASPLFGLLAKDSKFCWSDSFKEALEILKDKLTTTAITGGPYWALPFHIHADASNKDVEEALGQIDEKLPYAIYLFSKKLSKVELNYTVTEKEFLVLVHPLKKFKHYVTGYQTFVHTDHASIKYLMNKIDVNPIIIRRFLLLQWFDLTIVDK